MGNYFRTSNNPKDKECLTYSVEETGVILGVGRSVAYKLANDALANGKPYRAFRIGSSIKIPKKSFHEYLESLGA